MKKNFNNNRTYNNCFCIGGKATDQKGNKRKVPGYIDLHGNAIVLWGGKKGPHRREYERTYEHAKKELDSFIARKGENRSEGEKSLRVSLYLDNAMYDNLHIFVMDFDRYDEESDFFQAAKALADKVTRSQGGGYHMFFGINKEVATPLFDSINLLASETVKSYICYTGAISLDEKNKVDFFCDALRFIYEWQEWDNTIGLTDKTQEIYELIKDNFNFKRRKKNTARANKKNNTLKNHKTYNFFKEVSEEEIKAQMTDRQKAVFDDLKTNYSPDCTREEWFSRGLDIYHVFGDELGGSVFSLWSKPGHSYNPQSCAATWDNICERGSETRLYNSDWDFAISAF